MFFTNLIIPMRAQPFHFGHMHLLRTISKMCHRGVVILCRDNDNKDNPFTFKQRKEWITKFLHDEGIANITIPNRSKKMYPRIAEYLQFFDNVKDISEITVLSTNETNPMYQRDGFTTCNHHSKNFVATIWNKFPCNKQCIKLEGTGRIIRKRIKIGLSCKNYLTKEIEEESKQILRKIKSNQKR